MNYIHGLDHPTGRSRIVHCNPTYITAVYNYDDVETLMATMFGKDQVIDESCRNPVRGCTTEAKAKQVRGR